MEFRTILRVREMDYRRIDYDSEIMLLGSCFAENIGEKLNYFQFKHVINPFGILYHPLAIENFLNRSIHSEYYESGEVFEMDGIWRCFDAHSRLNSTSAEDLLVKLNKTLDKSRTCLQKATHIIITLGTSWVYYRNEDDKIVANCHKVPHNQFRKDILNPDRISESVEAMFNTLKNFNPNMEVVFTVSPIRHLRDGMVENTRSKAHLITGLHTVIEKNPGKIFYHPAYETMMDDLRDYRFYEEDMIHPNATAIHYLWKQFYSAWFHPETAQVMKEVDAVQKGLLHRPFNANSKNYRQFKSDLEGKISFLKARYDHMNFTKTQF
ncbi:MAG: GSCFA domain-containing protein [Flavobacteriaceae bacterium]|nr:GSCFA domain-containing protein [Flavobacteriaceae bacterium]